MKLNQIREKDKPEKFYTLEAQSKRDKQFIEELAKEHPEIFEFNETYKSALLNKELDEPYLRIKKEIK